MLFVARFSAPFRRSTRPSGIGLESGKPFRWRNFRLLELRFAWRLHQRKVMKATAGHVSGLNETEESSQLSFAWRFLHMSPFLPFTFPALIRSNSPPI